MNKILRFFRNFMNIKNVGVEYEEWMNEIGIVNGMLENVNKVLRKCWDCVMVWLILQF